MPPLSPELIECPRCGNIDRIVDCPESSGLNCSICGLDLRQDMPDTAPPVPSAPKASARAKPADAATFVDAISRDGQRILPALDEELPEIDAPNPSPQPPPFAKPIPQPRIPDPLQLPEFKRYHAPVNPIVFRPMIPGTIDPILALHGRSRSATQPDPGSNPAVNAKDPGDYDSDGYIRPVDIFMNRIGPNGPAFWSHSRLFIPLALLALGALLAGAGWLLVATFKSSGL